MELSRQIWANLIEVDSNYVLTLNEHILGEDLMLASYLKREEESLGEFLKRVKEEAKRGLSIIIRSIFFGFWDKEFNLMVLREITPLKQGRFSLDFKTCLEQLLGDLNLELAGSFKLSNCLAGFFGKLRSNNKVVLLSSSKEYLHLTNLDGQKQGKKLKLGWEDLLKKMIPAGLTKREFDLYLRYGFNLADLDASLLIPKLDITPYHLKVRGHLKRRLESLGLEGKRCVIIRGFLTTFKGIKTFLSREFDLEVVTSIRGGITSDRLLNDALNYSIKAKGLLKPNTTDTGEYAIRLKRATRMLE